MSTGNTPWLYDVHGLLKPKFRGRVHLWAIAPVLIAGLVLIAVAPTTQTRIAIVIYVFAITGMFTSSAIYHRAHVNARTQSWLRRLDHSMIGVATAGSYTPVITVLLDGTLRATLLGMMWAGAVGSLLISLFAPKAPRALRAAVYLGLGWAGAIAMPWLWIHGGVAAFTLVIAGAILYSAGGIIYALRKPNPWPKVFGFHEVFHVFVLAAAICHFIAVAIVINKAPLH